MVSTRLGKPTSAPLRLFSSYYKGFPGTYAFETVLRWAWLMTTLSRSCLFRTDRRALLLSTPLSSRQPTVRRPWFGDYPAGGLFSPHARIWVEGSENHNPPALFFFFCGDQIACTNSTLEARISPQWFLELRQLWVSVSWQVACELFSLVASHGILEQHVVRPLRFQ